MTDNVWFWLDILYIRSKRATTPQAQNSWAAKKHIISVDTSVTRSDRERGGYNSLRRQLESLNVERYIFMYLPREVAKVTKAPRPFFKLLQFVPMFQRVNQQRLCAHSIVDRICGSELPDIIIGSIAPYPRIYGRWFQTRLV